MVPVAVAAVQVPVVVTVNGYVPDTEGVPLIVYVKPLRLPDIPVGKPDTDAPVAPPLRVYTILVPNAVF
jgi:hypothetical protein